MTYKSAAKLLEKIHGDVRGIQTTIAMHPKVSWSVLLTQTAPREPTKSYGSLQTYYLRVAPSEKDSAGRPSCLAYEPVLELTVRQDCSRTITRFYLEDAVESRHSETWFRNRALQTLEDRALYCASALSTLLQIPAVHERYDGWTRTL